MRTVTILLVTLGLMVLGHKVFTAHAVHPRLIDYQWNEFKEPLTEVPGTITGREEFSYHAYRGGPRNNLIRNRNGEVLHAYAFTFKSQQNFRFNDVSYSYRQDVEPFSEITVEYPEMRPELARVKGMQAQPVPFWEGAQPYLMSFLWMLLIGIGGWRLATRYSPSRSCEDRDR